MNHSIVVHAVYSQLKEALRGSPSFLLGTPGSLSVKQVDSSDQSYVYRGFLLGGKRKEDFICASSNSEALNVITEKISEAKQIQSAIKELRTLGFQVLDKDTGNVLASLYNRGLVGHTSDTLTVIGTLAYCALLNELGIKTQAARTLDIDLVYHKNVKLVSKSSFEDTVKRANDGFFVVPGMPNSQPSTSLKVKGVDGIIVDVLTSGPSLAKVVRAPNIDWNAQTIPYLDFLTESPINAIMLAGNHAVPCKVPSPEAFVVHKIYSANHQNRDEGKRKKDEGQARTIYEYLISDDPDSFDDFLENAPAELTKIFRHWQQRL